MEQNNWEKDVAMIESHIAQMKKLLEFCKAGSSAEECIAVFRDLNARQLGQVVTDLVDSCVPVCLQLQRAAAVKTTITKEEKKGFVVDDVTEVADDKKNPSWQEAGRLSIQVSSVSTKEDSDVPKKSQEKTSFENAVASIVKKDTSLTETVTSIVEFIRTSSEALDPTPAVSNKTKTIETKKEEKTVLVDVVKVDNGNSSSADAASVEVATIPAVLEISYIPIKEEYQKPLDDVQRVKSLPESNAAAVALESASPSVPEEKEKTNCLVGAEEVSPVLQAPTFSPVREEGDGLPAVQVSDVRVKKEESFLQRFINCRKTSQSRAALVGLESANASGPKAKEVQVEEKVVVPPEKMGFVVGRNFANVDRLEWNYEVKVSIPPKGGNEVLLRGTAENVTRAKNDIIDHIFPTTLIHPVKKNYLFAIEGHRGKVMNGLRKNFEVEIKIDKNKEVVSITGRKERCEEALIAIKQIVSTVVKTVAGFDGDWDV